jgi:cytochrome c553
MLDKTNYFRSKRMMELVRELPCANCGAEDGTVCGAHPNWSWAGKGRSIKAHDLVAALCVRCHTRLDQGKDLQRAEREEMWLKAFYRTMLHAFRTGKVDCK